MTTRREFVQSLPAFAVAAHRLNISPDPQWIRPGLGALATDNAFVYGVRANATF